MSKKIKILNGPSREELFDGLRLFSEKRTVGFTIELAEGKKEECLVLMTGISLPSEVGRAFKAWHLEFLIAKPLLQGLVAKMPGPIDPTAEHYKVELSPVKAYYSTQTRNGTITHDVE